MAENKTLAEFAEIIRETIVPNGVKAITAQVMQNVLTGITDAAIYDISQTSGSTIEVVDNYVFDTNNYGDSTVTTPKMADSAVTTTKLATSSVTTPKMADSAVTTTKLASSSVTNAKLSDNSVSTSKVIDRAITNNKLATEVTEFLLTEDMKDYLNEKLLEELQEEAQSKFSGTTQNSGYTAYVYGTTPTSQATKEVYVNLTFNGNAVTADARPSGWGLSGTEYSYTLHLSGNTVSVGATTFNHTITSGTYSGLTVNYTSKAASIGWKYPVFYGFVAGNTVSAITSNAVKTLTYSENSVNTTTNLTNNLSNEAYLVILTRNTATATQLGLNILANSVGPVQFTSPKNTSISMSGYYVYFSKNSISTGSTLNNVTLNIQA